MRKKRTTKLPYFTVESAMSAILRDAISLRYCLDLLTKLWTLELVWTWTLDLVFFYDFTHLQCNLKLIIGSFMYIFGWSP